MRGDTTQKIFMPNKRTVDYSDSYKVLLKEIGASYLTSILCITSCDMFHFHFFQVENTKGLNI